MKKQIEVMAVENLVAFLWHNTSMYDEDQIFDVAEALVNAGYRKQEWISVEDRLPENDNRVLVYMHENRMSYTKIDTDRIVSGKWVRWGDTVTHWMPLPDAPKGGEG